MGTKRLGFILLLILVSVVLPNVGKVEAGSTVYIRADGIIDPVSAPISTFDSVTYTLTGDVYDSIVVERDNIVIDGNGHLIQGTGNGTGIDLTDREHVTIKNTQIRNFEYGIRLLRSDNCIVSANNITDSNDGIRVDTSPFTSVTENTVTNSTMRGIIIVSSFFITISENTLTDNDEGIEVAESSFQVTVSGNTVTDNRMGIAAGSSSNNNTISENTVTNNQYGIYFWNSSDTDVSGNTITNSTTQGINLTFTSNITVSNNSLTDNPDRGISIVNSSSSTVYGNTLTNSEYGIFSSDASDFSVSGNNLVDSYVGIYFREVSSALVSGNTLTNSTVLGFEIYDSFNSTFSSNTITSSEHGAYFWNSSDTDFSGNTITNITTVGFALYNSSTNTVYGNTLTNNFRGIYLWTVSNNTVSGNTLTGSTSEGIRIDEASNCAVTGNIVTNNNDGVYFENVSHSTISENMLSSNWGSNILSQSSHVTVSNNFIFNNAIGFSVFQSSDSTFYHNNFVNNGVQVSTSATNVWDNGFPSGGNYWSDYTERYPEAEELNGSAIWDTPYVINGENQDDYPLMQPYSYELIITTTAGGTTDPPAGTNYYPAGSLVTVTAVPETEYVFDYWLLDSIERVDNPITLMMDGNHNLEAFFVDVTPPATSQDYNGTWHNSDFTITLSAIDNGSGVSETYYKINDGPTKTVSTDGQPIIDTEDANNTLQYWSVDNAGNEETPNMLTDIKLDKTAPTSQINLAATSGNGGWFTSDVTVSLSSTDSVSGVDKIEYSFNNVSWNTYSTPLKITAEGNFSIYYRATDKAGNVEATKTETGKLDKTAPVSAIDIDGTTGNDEWFTSQVTESFSATDGVSEVDKTEYSLDNVNWNVYSAPFTIADGGDFTIYYRSIDKAGNVEATKTETGKLDKTAPTSLIDLTAATENNGWFTSDVMVSLSATDSASGLEKTEYRLHNFSWETYVSPFIVSDEGSFSVYYRSIDKAGNIETVKIGTVKLDWTPPQGSILINENALYTSSLSVTLTLSADDTTSGVAKMRFSNDGTEWSNWETYLTTKTWTLPATDGTKTVYVQFTDNADISSETYHDTIQLDATLPTVDAGQDQTAKVDGVVTFSAKASSDNIGIISYLWDFGDGTTSTSETTTHTYNSTGTYTVTLTAKDAANNTKTTQITVTITSPELIPLWLIAVIAAIAIVAVAVTVYFMKKKKT